MFTINKNINEKIIKYGPENIKDIVEL